MIYDIILVLIFAVFIAVNIHRGAAKALAGILVSVLAYSGASFLSKLLSASIYDELFRPSVYKAAADAVEKLSSGSVTQYNETVPTWITALLKAQGIDLGKFVTGNLTVAADTAGNTLNDIIRPLAVDIITFVLTILLFLVLSLVLRWILIKPLLRICRLPGINFVNRFLGGVIGFADAFLAVSLLAYLLKLIIPAVSSGSDMLNESTIYNSFIFYHFYSGNIFTAIMSLI